LMCETIIAKGGRITAAALGRTWTELIDPAKFGLLLGPQDQVIIGVCARASRRRKPAATPPIRASTARRK